MTITTSTIDETLIISVDRPPVNALDIDTIAKLEHVFAVAAREAPVNGVVLTGGGQVFSAGVDTRAFSGYSRDQRHEMVRGITRMVARLLAIPKPAGDQWARSWRRFRADAGLRLSDCGGHKICKTWHD